jgi:antibiotic biosynthesis monooxygenase (ABM) superfamily enzyme
MSAPAPLPPPAEPPVTVVTQTRVLPGKDDDFARWQQHMSGVVSRQAGFIKQTVIPPSPPVQTDWVILQRFLSRDNALAWLGSEERKRLVMSARAFLVGEDDVHLFSDESDGSSAPVSVVISTRVKPGCEAEYRQWERRIAAAQAKAAGFQGYRFEEPVPSVQDDWLAVLRFDSEPHLRAWLASPVRQELLEAAAPFTVDYRTRIAQTGFDQWFQLGGAQGSAAPPAWKQNMLVLMMLYPVVFLFGTLVGTPLLSSRLDLPFWLALFIGNVVSVVLLNWLVPWASKRFAWWLQPTGDDRQRTDIAGAGIVIAVYAVCLAVFSQFP